MARILVTGGTGVLGRRLVPLLAQGGHQVRVLSRSRTASVLEKVRVVRGDLASGDGLIEATSNVEVVVHAATSPFRRTRTVDVAGTALLLERAAAAGVSHLVYVSMVGVDRHPLAYYKRKYEAELLIEESEVPFTILRATQFHELIHNFLRSAGTFGFIPVPRGFRFQVVDSGEVARRLAELCEGPPGGRASDFGGPRVRRIEALAASYLKARRRPVRLARVPLRGRVARAFQAGWNTCPENAVGTVTWEHYLQARMKERAL